MGDFAVIDRTRLKTLAAACAALLTAQASAQQTVAETILEESAEAIRDLKDITFDATLETVAGDRTRIVEGSVKLKRLDMSDPVGALLAAEGTISFPHRDVIEGFALAYDGEIARRFIPDQNLLKEGEVITGGEIVLDSLGMHLVPAPLLEADPFNDQRAVEGASYLGTEAVEGEMCTAVSVSIEGGRERQRWAISTTDQLPRLFHRQYTSSSGRVVESTLTLTNVRTDITLGAQAFELSMPPDVTVEAVKVKAPPPVQNGDYAPDFTLMGADGREHSLSDYKGSLVLLDFWATWCPHCRRAVPYFNNVMRSYGPRDFVVLGVNCREVSKSDPVKYAQSLGMSYPVLLDGNDVAARYRVRGIPAMFLIGDDGRVLYQASGFSDETKANLLFIMDQYLKGRNR